MAEFAMYGPQTGGFRAWEQDEQAGQLNDLALRTGEQQLSHSMEIAPLDRRRRELEIQKLAIEQKREQAYMDALANRKARTTGAQPGQAGPTGAPGAPGAQVEELASELSEIAGIMMDSGKIEDARKIAGTLSSITARQGLAAYRQAQQLKTQFQTQVLMMDKAAGYARAADTPAKWQQAGDEFEMEYGFRPAIFQQPFDPATRQRALEAALTERQAAQIAHEQALERLRQQELGIRSRQVDVQERLGNARLDLSRRRLERLEKVGVLKPDRADKELATDAKNLLRQNHPDLAGEPTELQVAGASIASEAQMLLRTNPGLTRAQALAQAYTNQKADIQTTAQTDLGILGKWGGKIKFNALGRTPTTALPLPAKADAKLLSPGKYYQQGKDVRRWTGAGWEAVTTGGRADNQDDDEEDDD